ncbi:HD-GYP domain-containing protein [Roseateles sp. BYS180W]|uniref:HD-GYP domain-containing protein n=1 Tax=Roseateles rivi TaxID=3299028 RepID=A0ABW7FS11_9BURK
MLKRITTKDLRLGMYIQSLEGSWLSHPFWKAGFVLRDAQQLDQLQRSGVAYCCVDEAKSIVLPADGLGPAVAPPTPVAAPPEPPPPAQPSGAKRVSMAGELAQATRVVERSRAAVTSMFSEVRMGQAIQAEQCQPLVQEIADSVQRNPSALISLARLKGRDDYTYMHSVAVCALMVALARQLGLSEEDTRAAGMAGLLHDVGKMAIPLAILNKPGKLTDDEFALMRSHPQRGHDWLLEGKGVPAGALDVCLNHHEKLDGSGYPNGLAAEAISLLARMGAVCDVYDAVTSLRPYKNPWDPAEAISRMARWQGTHFDPAVFRAFVMCVGIYPVGTLVRLQSTRLAVVVGHNPDAPTAPQVKVMYSTKSQMPLPQQLLDLAAPGCTDKIVGREQASDWGFTHLDDFWRDLA